MLKPLKDAELAATNEAYGLEPDAHRNPHADDKHLIHFTPTVNMHEALPGYEDICKGILDDGALKAVCLKASPQAMTGVWAIPAHQAAWGFKHVNESKTERLQEESEYKNKISLIHIKPDSPQ